MIQYYPYHICVCSHQKSVSLYINGVKRVDSIRISLKQELVDGIHKYFDEVNEIPIVRHWKYRMEDFGPNGSAN